MTTTVCETHGWVGCYFGKENFTICSSSEVTGRLNNYSKSCPTGNFQTRTAFSTMRGEDNMQG